jgi:hypothetical protein
MNHGLVDQYLGILGMIERHIHCSGISCFTTWGAFGDTMSPTWKETEL